MSKSTIADIVLSFASLLAWIGFAITAPAFLVTTLSAVPYSPQTKQSESALPRSETYSADGSRVAFQTRRQGDPCPRVYVSNADGSDVRAVSPRSATASGAAFFPSGDRLVYSETRCPASANAFPTSNLFVVNADGTSRTQLANAVGYNGDATVSPNGHLIVFTSTRDGDPAIYKVSSDGKDPQRLTEQLGYEGAPLFSPDGNWIAFRAAHPSTPGDLARFRERLQHSRDALQPVELWIMHPDGSSKRQLTNDAAHFGPYFSADSRRIVYGTSFRAADGRSVTDLYAADLNGAEVARITNNFESDEEVRRRKELDRTYVSSIRNRDRLRESKPFGLLKVLAYVLIGFTMLVVMLRAASAVLPALRSTLLRIEDFLVVKGAFFVDSLSTVTRKKKSGGDNRTTSLPASRRDRKHTLQRQ